MVEIKKGLEVDFQELLSVDDFHIFVSLDGEPKMSLVVHIHP